MFTCGVILCSKLFCHISTREKSESIKIAAINNNSVMPTPLAAQIRKSRMDNHFPGK